MPLFLAAIFLSAFLVFQVQPVIARCILPWYGGSPAVWTTCLLFFQLGLLGGYAYAHGLVVLLRQHRRLQVGIHLSLLLLACLALPIVPSPEWKPDGTESSPLPGIVRLLALTVGAPYVLLSASGPLLQHWFGESYPGRSPYRLYAVSNLGSLLGLLTYPFVFEPLLDLRRQAVLWSCGFLAYLLLAAASGLHFAKRSGLRADALDAAADDPPPPRWDVLFWITFSACGSMLLLSLTSQMCQDVAVVPFLWVLPLSLYLGTFVIAFDHARWYVRPVAIPLAALAVGATIWLMSLQFASYEWDLGWQILVYCSAVFLCCLVCHGEIVRLKPGPRHLTGFYLAISLGGALGGLFVNLVAPAIFKGYWELHLAFVLLAVLTSVQLWRGKRHGRRPLLLTAGGLVRIAILVALAVFLRRHIADSQALSVETKRGFYGVLRVSDEDDHPDASSRSLHHGRINHGVQFLDAEHRST
ncbi:MAG TPA: hypothetical protein PLA50_18080, partial [Bacteroidia bacterium]|nr:hypothetical protein [Bacteroidia bacterium]